jgi:hypothetical protein
MPIVRTLGASHLASEGWEIQRKNNFELTVPGVGESERALALGVVSASLPTESNEVITVNYGNTNIKVAGTVSFEGGTLVVRDLIQKDMERIIDKWRALVHDKETKAIHLAPEYKRQARITQYAPDGSYERVWKLRGMWPSSVNYGELSNNDGSLKEITVTFQYDEAVLDR